MLLSQSNALHLLLVARFAMVADPGAELRVLRVVPAGEAAPTTSVSVTFDRLVAGSLDRSVDPRTIFTIAPAVAGAVDWRDPVTLRFRPAAPLEPNRAYTVTVADRFAAMDGSRLARPYTFSFRVRGPRVLADGDTITAESTDGEFDFDQNDSEPETADISVTLEKVS